MLGQKYFNRTTSFAEIKYSASKKCNFNINLVISVLGTMAEQEIYRIETEKQFVELR